jgi:hypothetical protein
MIMAQGMMAHLVTPAFLVNRAATLVFFNAPASRLLGVAYEDAGALPHEDWAGRLSPADAEGEPLPLGELPVSIALSEGRPAYRAMRILGADGSRKSVEAIAFPIVGRTGPTGALAIYWDGQR